MAGISGEFKDWPEMLPFAKEIVLEQHGSPRAEVLVSAAMIESVLRRMLERFLIHKAAADKLLQGSGAPLGTFSARIKGAHALGLISDAEAKCLDIIRDVRNDYAHKFSEHIGEQSVEARMRNLAGAMPERFKAVMASQDEALPRDLFVNCVIILSGYFSSRMTRIDENKRTLIEEDRR